MKNSLKIPENITFEYIDKKAFVLNINNGEYYKLSESASIIFKEIQKGVDIENIKINIKALFAEHKNIDSDIDETIKDFINLKIVEYN